VATVCPICNKYVQALSTHLLQHHGHILWEQLKIMGHDIEVINHCPLCKTKSHKVPSVANKKYIIYEYDVALELTKIDALKAHMLSKHSSLLFEKFNASWQGKGMTIQQNLFPIAIQLSPTDAQLLQSILPDLLQMGYQLEPFGNNAFLLQGSPADHPSEDNQSVIEMMLEDVKDASSTLHHSYKEKIAKTLARKHAVKAGKKLDEMEYRPFYRTRVPSR
jgi:DNA mismatch repair ATPase MutL